MNTSLKKNLLEGEFKLAKEIVKNMKYDELEGELLEIGFDTDDISVYLFILNMVLEQENAELHSIASTIMSTVFSHLPGAYYISYNHMKRATDMVPENYEYKEGLLLFYRIPDKIINREEALKIAKDIVKINPENKTAKQIIEEL